VQDMARLLVSFVAIMMLSIVFFSVASQMADGKFYSWITQNPIFGNNQIEEETTTEGENAFIVAEDPTGSWSDMISGVQTYANNKSNYEDIKLTLADEETATVTSAIRNQWFGSGSFSDAMLKYSHLYTTGDSYNLSLTVNTHSIKNYPNGDYLVANLTMQFTLSSDTSKTCTANVNIVVACTSK